MELLIGRAIICDRSNLLIFPDYLSTRLLEFVYRINRGPFIGHLKYYLTRKSTLFRNVSARFRDMYGVNDIFENDLQALRARIKFVSDHEPRFIRPDFL